jgi:ABC-2 type transport system permease protein
MLRSRVALAAGLLLFILTAVAMLVSHEQTGRECRARPLRSTGGPAMECPAGRHPHRVVHYGQYIFRPLSPLASFDFGVDPYTGHLVSRRPPPEQCQFQRRSQSSLLLRFGQLTPAFVLQTAARC